MALRGRGGAGFPTGLEVDLPARRTIPGPIYFCLNADESEPGTFNNRILMEDDPHQVLEGPDHQLLSPPGRRPPTSTCATNIRMPIERLQAAIDECYAAGYLGRTSWAAVSRSTSTCTAGPPPTSAAKRPG